MPGHTRYSRCSLVTVEVLTKIMQELIAHSQVKAPALFHMIQGAKTFKDRLSKTDFITIQTLLTDDYSKLDITLVYKIAKFFHLIPQPTRNWGANPLPHEKEVGDDVERIRRARNDLVHKIDCNYSEKELQDFFREFIEVGERVDRFLQKPIGSGFKEIIQSYQVCSIDEDMEKKYTEIVQQMEQLKEKFRVKTGDKEVRIYYSKSLQDVIQDIRDLGSNHASSSTTVKIIIKGIEDPEAKAQLLNSVKEATNRGAFDIEFKSAHRGSLILYVDIKNELFADDNRIACEISLFIRKIFRIGELTFFPQDANGVIITIDQDLFDNDDVQADDAESLYYNSGNLVLDIEVKNNVFLTDESMRTYLGGFVRKLMTKANGSKIFQNPVTTAVMELGEPGKFKDDKENDAKSNQPSQRKTGECFKMRDRFTPSFFYSDSDDSTDYIGRNPRLDRHFFRKQELLWNCKQLVGVSGHGRQPLTIAVIGTPGNGKTSFLNTVFAAFSNTHWSEYAKYVEYGRRDKQVTRMLKSFQKKDYYKDQDQYLMPTFLDITGFNDDASPLNKELLNIVFCGKLKGEEPIDVIRYGNEHGVKAVHDKYLVTTCFGLLPNRLAYHRVKRVILVCSANPDLPIPVSLIEAVTEVTNRERDIILYGVLTQTDKYKHSNVRVMEKEKNFMKVLGIPKTRFARIKNYCPDIIPDMSYKDNIVPSLDVPVLRLMRQVLAKDSSDKDLTAERQSNWLLSELRRVKALILLSTLMVFVSVLVVIVRLYFKGWF